LLGPHGITEQKPPTGTSGVHVSPSAWQFVHCAPLAPHTVGLPPFTHTLPWQQPLQLFGPHVGGLGVQTPAMGETAEQMSPS
jgi:hypothetical protein